MKVGLNATCFNNRPSGAKQRFIGIYSELIKRMPNTEFLIYEPGTTWNRGVVIGARFPDDVDGASHRHLP